MNDIIRVTEIPNIVTDRLLLRELSFKDTDDVYEYASIPAVTTFLVWHPHQSRQDSIDFINFAKEQFVKNITIIWGIEFKEERKLIGTIDLRNTQLINNCGEIGYVISNKYWNRGIMTEALKSVIKFGFNDLKLHRIEAHCETENIGSSRVMEKAGMKNEGVLREKIYIKNKYRSMKMFSILKSEYFG
jgi:ribosomal-protein-alanine N-acetyltransferase